VPTNDLDRSSCYRPTLVRTVRSTSILLVLAFVAAACVIPYRTANYSFTVESNVVYGQGSVNGGNGVEDLLLDLYVPDVGSTRRLPLMLMIHGGSFTGGSKTNADVVTSAEEYAKRGYLVASIDYRLQGDVPKPSGRVKPLLDAYGTNPPAILVSIVAAVDDTLTALDFLQARSDVFAQWTTLWGSSAGAITALITGYALDDRGIQRPPVAAVVDLWGGFYGANVGNPFDDPDGSDPVLYAVHGSLDTTVPFAFGQQIGTWATEAGLPHEYYPIAGAGHGVNMFSTQASPGTSLYQRSVDFLGETVFEGRPGGPYAVTPPDRRVDLQLLAVNDFHGRVKFNSSGTLDGQPAGGSEYLSTKLTQLRAGVNNSLTVAAGDLIGASPAFSDQFHDEPAVEALDAMQLDISGVGNHEFDEGVAELLRMQNGGCHPVDGCYFPAEPYAGADFQWLAANVVENSTGNTILPPYEIRDVGGVDVAFIGMTLEGTPSTPSFPATGNVGYTFADEVVTANALADELDAMGVKAIVLLLHEGLLTNPLANNGCSGIAGPVVAINAGLSPKVDVVITGHTHEPYICSLPDPAGNQRSVTSAYSYARLVTEIDLQLDAVTGDVVRDTVTAVNHPVIQSQLTRDPAVTAVVDKWQAIAN
jgi:predicted esterase